MARLQRPINSIGKTKMRWAAWQKRQRSLVMARCRGMCECCKLQPAQEWHHCFGRRHICAEPLASHHTMTAGLCADCHRLITRDPVNDANQVQQSLAIRRAIALWPWLLDGWITESPYPVPIDDLIGMARQIEDALKSTGEWAELCQEAGRP